MYDISIIIPLYNCENYINQAIDSIIDQNDVKTEIIVVNDGSTDDSLKKLSAYGSSIKVVTTSNQGASAARNTGLRLASSKYVMFLDADDFLNDKNICKEVIEKMERLKCQVGMFLYTYYNNQTKKETHLKCFPAEIVEKTACSELVYNLISCGIIPMTPCCKVIERNFLLANNLFFLEGMTAEDIEWFVRLIIKLDRFCLINNDSYMYRKNLEMSVTGNDTRLKNENHYFMINRSVQELYGVDDQRKRNALFSALAYQFCIWCSKASHYLEKEEFHEKVNSLLWILNYDLFPRVRYVRWLYKCIGDKIYTILSLYYSFLSKSK